MQENVYTHELRKMMDELVELGIFEVRTDEHGERHYRLTKLGRACKNLDSLGTRQ
jgi:predicted transcriptional regulator